MYPNLINRNNNRQSKLQWVLIDFGVSISKTNHNMKTHITFVIITHLIQFWFFIKIWIEMTHSQVPGWTHLRVHQSVVVESWDSEGAPDFQHYRGVEGRARSPGIRLGKGTRRSSLNLHPQTNHTGLVSHSGTPLGVGTSHEHFGPQDSSRPGLGGSHHLPPYSIFCDALLRLHSNGYFSRDSQVGVPKLSRNCSSWSPGTLGAHNSRLPGLIATRYQPKL
jgi:hypothetical protein